MSKSYEITALELGPMENFVYLITDLDSKKTAVVDPAWEPAQIIEQAQAKGLNVTDVLLTHSHHDHINAVEDMLNYSDPQLHLLKEEAEFWQVDLDKPSLHSGGDHIQIGETSIQILHTPGHTPGSACYLLNDDVITGDTLFVFGCGRCDLQGGDPEKMFNTLKKMKAELPSQTIVHPGHNYAVKKASSLEEQIQGNPFLHHEKCSDFVDYRMHVHDKIRDTPYEAITKDQL